MQMSIPYALALLGLSWNDRTNYDAICKAWKIRLKLNHPDKNGSLHATEWTQRFNQAKDLLLQQLNHQIDKEATEGETQRTAEAQRSFQNKIRQCYEKAKHSNHSKPQFTKYPKKLRKPTIRGTRVHCKTTDYLEGKTMLDEMKHFFKTYFIPSAENIYMHQINDFFITTHPDVTLSEMRLFHRHARRLIAAEWPYARYTKHKCKWSYYGIAFNKSK